MDRLQLRRDRRERIVCLRARRQRPAATDNERRRHLLLQADLGARQQEAALERPIAKASLCRCWNQSGHANRSGQVRRDRSLQLVTRQSVDHVGSTRGEWSAEGLSLFTREQAADSHNGYVVRLGRARLQR